MKDVIQEILDSLRKANIRILEDEDLVTLYCNNCKCRVATFSSAGVMIDSIKEEAQKHKHKNSQNEFEIFLE